MSIIQSKRDLRDWLSVERDKYYKGNRLKSLIMYLIGYEPVIIWSFQKRLRITEYHYNCGHRIRYYINFVVFNKMRIKYGINICLNSCGKGLKIMHLGSILINKYAQIGEDVSIHINTAIVAHGISDAAPVIGNDVVIGVGSTLVGGIRIADGIAIGANSLVNKSFEEQGIAIAGVPAKKISDNGKAKWNTKHINKDSGRRS